MAPGTSDPLIGLPAPTSPSRSRTVLAAWIAAFLLVAGLTVLPQDAPLAHEAGGAGSFELVSPIELRAPDGQSVDPRRVTSVGADPGRGVFIFAEEYADDSCVDVQGVNLEDEAERCGVNVYLVDTTSLRQVATIQVPGLVWTRADTTTQGGAGWTTNARVRSPVSYGLDLVNHRLFVADTPSRGDAIRIGVASLTGEHEPVVQEIPASALLPGAGLLDTNSAHLLTVSGDLSYYPPEDVLYVATEGIRYVANVHTVMPLRVHELNVARIIEPDFEGQSGNLISDVNAAIGGAAYPDGRMLNWSYEVPYGWCTSVVGQDTTAVRRSIAEPDLVTVVCAGNTPKDSSADAIAGQVGGGYRDGFVHLDLQGERGRDARPNRFASEFIGAPAKISGATASPDPSSELIVIQTRGFPSPRAYVYDPVQRAVRGAAVISRVSTPALDPWSGQLYVPTSHPDPDDPTNGNEWDAHAVKVLDTRHLVIPTGTEHETGLASYASRAGVRFIVDPGTRRLVVPGACLGPNEDECTGYDWFVIEDTRVLDDVSIPDWDAATENVEEVPGSTVSTLSGTARGFGARTTFVGGIGGLAGSWFSSSGLATVYGLAPALGVLSDVGQSGTRDVVFAQVPDTALTVSSSTPSVAATAVGLRIDQETATNLRRGTSVEIPSGPVLSEGRTWPDDYRQETRAHPSNCFGTEVTTDARPGSSVTCDATVPAAGAAAVYSPERDAGADSPLEPLVRIGDSEVVTTVTRDADRGTVVRAEAVARNVELLGGALRIGEARTLAEAVAFGRPGTATTTLTREFKQVAIGLPGEEPVFTCGMDDPCDPLQVVRAINTVLQPRVTAFIPPQDVSLAGASEPSDDVSNGTPGGARAAVQRDLYDQQSDDAEANFRQSELPAIVLVIANDGEAPSRFVVQLAGVTLDAHYRVNSLPAGDPGSPPLPPPPPTPPLPSPPPLPWIPDDQTLAGSAASREISTPIQTPVLEPLTETDSPAPRADEDDPRTEAPPPPPQAPSPPLRVEPPPATSFETPVATGPQAPTSGEPSTVVAGPASGQTPPPQAVAEQRLARQRAADGTSLALLAGLGLVPGYLGLRRRLLRP